MSRECPKGAAKMWGPAVSSAAPPRAGGGLLVAPLVLPLALHAVHGHAAPLPRRAAAVGDAGALPAFAPLAVMGVGHGPGGEPAVDLSDLSPSVLSDAATDAEVEADPEVAKEAWARGLVVVPSNDARSLFEEAKIGAEHEEQLRKLFNRFVEDSPDGLMDLEAFHRFAVDRYGLCDLGEEAAFFYAMNRRRDGRMTFEEFFLGCSAADPSTMHILNSFTGFERLKFTYDFYNISRTGTLTCVELAKMLADRRRQSLDSDEGEEEAMHREAVEVAQELGDVDTVTLRISSLAGLLGPVRASRQWTWHLVKREIAQTLGVPIEEQSLVHGSTQVLSDLETVSIVAPEGVLSLDITLVRIARDEGEGIEAPLPRRGVVGAERLVAEQRRRSHASHDPEGSTTTAVFTGMERFVHVSFRQLYGAMQEEQLRGTSKLFRFKRRLLKHRGSKSGGA